jgi:hypothetical protein
MSGEALTVSDIGIVSVVGLGPTGVTLIDPVYVPTVSPAVSTLTEIFAGTDVPCDGVTINGAPVLVNVNGDEK